MINSFNVKLEAVTLLLLDRHQMNIYIYITTDAFSFQPHIFRQHSFPVFEPVCAALKGNSPSLHIDMTHRYVCCQTQKLTPNKRTIEDQNIFVFICQMKTKKVAKCFAENINIRVRRLYIFLLYYSNQTSYWN